jgi:hypothetical protein
LASACPNSGDISGAVWKSPAGTELARAGRVVAEPGRVQREPHERRERNPSAGAPDLAGDMRGDLLRVRFSASGSGLGKPEAAPGAT